MLFPPRCLTCGQHIEQQGALCTHCWKKLHFIAAPMCRCCGFPFEFDVGEMVLCGRCIESSPDYTQARSVLVYDDTSRDIILQLKHADQTHVVPWVAAWMVRAAGDFLAKTDMIIPVPLHRSRLWVRKYNQAALLAYGMTKDTQLRVLPSGLVRTQFASTQGGLNRRQRQENVKTAFAVHPRYATSLHGKTILLVDDVMTTGATLNACARALKKAYVKDVMVITLARTV